jgi:hypothetical protein
MCAIRGSWTIIMSIPSEARFSLEMRDLHQEVFRRGARSVLQFTRRALATIRLASTSCKDSPSLGPVLRSRRLRDPVLQDGVAQLIATEGRLLFAAPAPRPPIDPPRATPI